MNALLFEVGPGLAFRFEGLGEGLATRVASFLSFFAADGAAPTDPAARPLIVSSAPPPPVDPAALGMLLAEDGLEVRAGSGVTIFETINTERTAETPGIVGWCEPGRRRGGICSSGPGSSTPESLDRFVGLALAPLLIELAEAAGWMGLHAAAVAIEGRGLLIPGPSGAGKSTLFRGCRRAGHDVLSDDLVWLFEAPIRESGFLMYPFPRRGAGNESVPAPTLDWAPVYAIVCPQVVDRQTSRLSAIAVGETVEALLDQSGLLGSDMVTRRRFRALVRLAGSVPGYRLEAGSRRDDALPLLSSLPCPSVR